MRIGIITIIDRNCGNRLQNYAAQEVLKQYGVVETIPFIKKDKRILSKWLIKKFLRKLKKQYSYAWEEFNLKIKFGPYTFAEKYHNVVERYDFVCLGSDQVWNTKWYEENPLRKDAFLLNFFDAKQKVCFAPSFGVSEIGDEWKLLFAEKLKEIPYLSVREEAGAEIIKQLTGKSAEVLIDPTLMLDANEWRKIEKKPRYLQSKKRIVLTYFLGELTEEMESKVSEIKKQYDCDVVNMHELLQNKDKNIGPAEFLYLLDHAFIVMTDSFHASVFSFIFEKPCLLYARAGAETGMLSRLDTLIQKFGLERKYINSGLENDLLECDYSYGLQQLEKERRKVRLFLESAFQNKNKKL